MNTLSTYFPNISFSTHWSPFTTSPKEARLSPIENLDSLIEVLKNKPVNQWIKWKKEACNLVESSHANLAHLDQFFHNITSLALEKDPHALSEFIEEVISFDLLTKIIRSRKSKKGEAFTNINKWASEHTCLYTENDQSIPITKKVISKWKKKRLPFLNFLKDLFSVLLNSFDFLDSKRQYFTNYDKYLRLDISLKILYIPFCLVTLLKPIFGLTAKVYIIATFIIVGVGILISSYQKWLKPIPSELVNCTNLDKQFEHGFIERKVGQNEELQQLVTALEVDSNVVLIGASGEGKTALIHQLVQQKHAGKLSEKLNKLKFFEVDCSHMISSLNYGHSELINQTKNQIENYEDKILFAFDEFYPIITNPGAFQAFKKRFLEDKPHSKFIATMTYAEYKELKKNKIDIDGSFQRRVTFLPIKSPSNRQIKLIIKEYINRFATDIPISKSAIKAILKVIKNEDYLPQIGKPAKAIKLLKDAIGECRHVYNPFYVSPELGEMQQEFQNLKCDAQFEGKVKSKTMKKIKAVKEQIDLIQKKLNVSKKQTEKIKKLIDTKNLFHREYQTLTTTLAEMNRKEKRMKILRSTVCEKKKIRYLWTYFYLLDSAKKLMRGHIDKVRATLPVELDANLINSIYEKHKTLEKTLQSKSS